jgi:hypothetical protein
MNKIEIEKVIMLNYPIYGRKYLFIMTFSD